VCTIRLTGIFPAGPRLDPVLDKRSAEPEQLLSRWGRLHAVRSVQSGLALLLFLYLAFWSRL
jgi:hypothetical protein